MPDASSTEGPLPENFQRKGRFQQTLKPAFSMKCVDWPNRAARFVGDNQMDPKGHSTKICPSPADYGGGTGISTA